jgi:hypothetical protein
MDEQKAIKKLQQQIDLIKEIKSKPRFSPEFNKWKRDTEVAIERIFGKDGRHLSDFTNISYSLSFWSDATPDYAFAEKYHKGLGA